MDLCQSSDDDDESPAAAAAAARPFAGGKPTWTCAPGFYEQPRKPAAKPAAKKKLLQTQLTASGRVASDSKKAPASKASANPSKRAKRDKGALKSHGEQVSRLAVALAPLEQVEDLLESNHGSQPQGDVEALSALRRLLDEAVTSAESFRRSHA